MELSQRKQKVSLAQNSTPNRIQSLGPNFCHDPCLELFKKDFEKASESKVSTWDALQGAQIFITGGTGFFGSWLIRALQWANSEKKLGIHVDVLSRNPEAFLTKHPEFQNLPFLEFISGDVRDFQFPEKSYTHVIHAATEASAKLNQENPLLMVDTIVQGTRRALEFARTCGASRFLLTSSGAVYGRQYPDITHCPENYFGGPDPTAIGSAYGEGKRMAEYLCTAYSHQHQLDTVVARCFAFAGPYLNWDIHFAIGNFIRDALNEGVIRVNGDGTPYRSYLYGADLAYWILTLLTHGKRGEAYNVGSETPLSIKEVAEKVAETISGMFNRNLEVRIARVPDASRPAERYVPRTLKAQTEFGLRENFTIRDCVQQSVEWHQKVNS